ncbi:hypothetical protein ACA910_019959 [Epithemia clementina (nom. ined.)]
MGLFRGRKRPRPAEAANDIGGDDGSSSSDDTIISIAHDASEPLSMDDAAEGLEDVMKDNLEVMLDIIMRIREDPQFAKSIYADCPRLQHLLDQRPDLRPVFEDPRLVRITFEKAYKEAGGELPEDNKKKSILAIIVNHPAFKFLRFLLFLKKLMNCVQGGGMQMLTDFFKDIFTHQASSHIESGLHHVGDHAGDSPGDGNGDTGNDDMMDNDGNPDNRDSKYAMYDAADKFETPEMQEKLDHLRSISDPEQLAEEIENDPELRTLRDSNDICAMLLSDPDTCNIVLDPDNLRALGECPDLIEADIRNPDWSTNLDIVPSSDFVDVDAAGDFDETGLDYSGDHAEVGQTDVDVNASDGHVALADDGGGDMVGEEDPELEEEDEEEGLDDEEEEEGEEEEEEEEGLEYELGEEELEEKNGATSAAKGNANKGASNAKDRAELRKAQTGNFFTNVAVGFSDMLAGQLVGFTAGEIMGGGDELGGFGDVEDVGGDIEDFDDDIEDFGEDMEDVGDAADDAGEAAEDAADEADPSTLLDNAADAAELLTEDDVADNLDTMEGGLDQIEETHDEHQEKHVVETAATGGAAVAGGSENNNKSREVEHGDAMKEDPAEEETHKKFGRFHMISTFVASVATAAKETVATSILGDDFGAMLVEKMEEEEEEEEEDEEESTNEEEKESTKDGDSKKETKNDNKFSDPNDIESGNSSLSIRSRPEPFSQALRDEGGVPEV